jgi:putative transposase
VRKQTPHADGTNRSESPKVCIMDSQSAKTSEEGGQERGYDAGKKVKGRKRHVVTDFLGLVLLVHVTSASVQDRDAALPMMREVKREFPSLEVVFMDGGYRGEVKSRIEKETQMRVEITLRSDPKKRFEPLPVRWKVERTFGWLNRYRLLSKEFERTIASSECDVLLCMSRLHRCLVSANQPELSTLRADSTTEANGQSSHVDHILNTLEHIIHAQAISC